MDFKNPVIVFTAANNIEAHVVVDMLMANGVMAYAVEDASAVSLSAFGSVGQFHKPNVWIDKSTAEEAIRLVQEFEDRQRNRRKPGKGSEEIEVECEECGRTSMFPDTLFGTVQDCPHCSAFVDVGELDWEEEDFGEAEEA